MANVNLIFKQGGKLLPNLKFMLKFKGPWESNLKRIMQIQNETIWTSLESNNMD
jgi:hypothetical protein